MNFSSDFGHWLAGFAAGEGCFDIKAVTGGVNLACTFHIALRADDEAILREIQTQTGIGNVILNSHGSGNPLARWTVGSKADCFELVEIFDRYPLRGRKAEDFLIWREGVALWAEARNGRRHDWTAMSAIQSALRTGRRFTLAA